MKKILKALALSFVVAFFGMFCLVGCDNNVSISEVVNFANASENKMGEGYRYTCNISGMGNDIDVKIFCKAGLDDALEIFSEYDGVGMYLTGGFAYLNDGTDKVKVAVNTQDSEYIQEINKLKEEINADFTEEIVELLELVSEIDAMKIKKVESENSVSYNINYKDFSGRLSVELKYTENKLESFSFYMTASEPGLSSMEIFMQIETFSGEIEFPEDLDSYTLIENSENENQQTSAEVA